LPRLRFIVTNLTLPDRAVVTFYNKRCAVEQWIKGQAGGALDAAVVSLVPGERGRNPDQRALWFV